jgi:lysophospholipase L1-like esterase
VINLGRSGDNSSQAAKRLLRYLDDEALQPNLVIFCAGANNDHNLSEARFLPRDVSQMGLAMRLNHLLAESRSYRLSQNTLKRIRGLLQENKNEASLRFDDLLNVREAEELRLLEDWIYRDIESVHRALVSRGAGLMLINYFHGTAQVDDTYARVSKDLDVPFLDVRNFGDPAYRFLLNRRALVASNFHPNQHGYARIAEMVFESLRNELLIDVSGDSARIRPEPDNAHSSFTREGGTLGQAPLGAGR